MVTTKTDTTNHKVLIVEDKSGLADIYSQWLADTYEVTTASDGQSSIDKLTDQFDVVLLDRRMPDISGDEVLDYIRSEAMDCRVAMVTGMHPDFDIVELGFDDYVVKPVSKNELCDLVQKLITLSTYSKEIQKAFQLAAKKSALEAEKSIRELNESKEYMSIERKLQDPSESLDSTIEEFDQDDLGVVFREIMS